MTARFILRVRTSELTERDGEKLLTPRIEVVDEYESHVQSFDLMCGAIDDDIQNPVGSGAATLEALRRVACGLSESEELGGNAWYTYITPGRVWFESQIGQGDGGAVSFEHYKLAVQTYVRFLSDPQHRPIEIEFSQ